MDKKYILAIDQGTSATKAILFDRRGRAAFRVNEAHGQTYPAPGWAEQDGAEIWRNTLSAIRGVLAESGAEPESIAALAITDQTETFLLWDAATGEPVAPAIGWQDNRSAALVSTLAGIAPLVEERTGIMLSEYYSAAKLRWLFNERPELLERAARGEVLFGTMECWLIYKLTGRHLSDLCNASRTQLLNIRTLDWDDELLDAFGFPRRMLPELRGCDGDFGEVNIPGLPRWPIRGVLGDSPGALFGQLGFNVGDIKVTYGTGSSVLMNLGAEGARTGGGIITTLGWVLGGEPTYVCEGSIICSGATVKWLKDELGLIGSSAESESVAASVEDTGGVYLVPAFTGLGGPWWDAQARAAILGMSRGTGRAHIVRAGLESIAYQVRDAVEIMAKNCAVTPGVIRADGGASRNKLLMQFQSDILNRPLACGAVEECSALGAAMTGGLAVGFWRDRGELGGLLSEAEMFRPRMAASRREELYAGWRAAVGRVLT